MGLYFAAGHLHIFVAVYVVLNFAVLEGKPFDGVLRKCASDPERVEAYLEVPPCPDDIPKCSASSNHCASLEILPFASANRSLYQIALSWFTGYREGYNMVCYV